MYLFLMKSILGSIVGSSFYSWWQNTRLGIWFQNKLDDTLDRLDWEILEKEDKWKKAYPNLADKLEDLELQVHELQDRVHSLDRKGVVGDFYD
jgi:hypothetical protein